MSKCTAGEAVNAFGYWDGYYEKASSSYATTRAKSAFTKNKGSNNYTYFGYFCGVQAQPWCAASITVAITEACGGDKAAAKEVMYGIYPYVNCAQVWDAAPNDKKFWSHYQRWTLGKGERKTYYPAVGDIVIFTDNGTSRSHTGMCVGYDSKYLYTREGNSGNMCRTRSYLLTSSYIYGWIRPNYKTGDTPTPTPEKYGAEITTKHHVLSKGCAGDEVKGLQYILIGREFSTSDKIGNGEFGTITETAVKAFQKYHGLTEDGIVGTKTWNKLLGVE